MGYKLKPNKAVAKRFKVTGTGKIKCLHGFSSHLRSGRTSKRKRQLGRPFIMSEGLARNMRRLMGVHKLKPKQIAAQRLLDARAKADAAPVEPSSATVA